MSDSTVRTAFGRRTGFVPGPPPSTPDNPPRRGPLRNAPKLKELLFRADQESVRSDLTIFFGKNADIFLKTYDKFRARYVERKRYFTWCWPAFFLGLVWLFYRKMYLAGAMFVLLPIVLSFVLNLGGAAAAYGALAVGAKPMYVHTALNRIIKADKLGFVGEERQDYLSRAGGVSIVAGVITGIASLGLILLAIASVAAK